ncbi:MAG: hypothetical protein D6689_03290 [Deltaproteobacteria bacterium]|nr:MAG: hypothetical protein D6689_03290 [Deltaproteobacteria bacterium]
MWLRVALLLMAVALAAASAGGQSPYATSATAAPAPPPSEPMAPERAAGLFRTSFGPVKIEIEPDRGAPYVHGVWVYDRDGQEVIGYFAGRLEGNVLEFEWQEPAEPEPLRGRGYLVFRRGGATFDGQWWTDKGDRSGQWTGERFEPGGPAAPEPPGPTDETI